MIFSHRVLSGFVFNCFCFCAWSHNKRSFELLAYFMPDLMLRWLGDWLPIWSNGSTWIELMGFDWYEIQQMKKKKEWPNVLRRCRARDMWCECFVFSLFDYGDIQIICIYITRCICLYVCLLLYSEGSRFYLVWLKTNESPWRTLNVLVHCVLQGSSLLYNPFWLKDFHLDV